MALGAVLGAALQTPVSLYYTLTLDSVSILQQPGVPNGLYGTLIDSIQVTEAGPGGTSSMQFVVDDPAGVLDVSDGAPVVYWNHFRNTPAFVGYVDTATETVLGTGGSKQITVRATGNDARLDWASLPADVTFAAGVTATVAIQSCAAQAVGLGPVDVAVSGGLADRGAPIAATWSVGTLPVALTIRGGTSMREAIRQICGQAWPSVKAAEPNFIEHAATLDWWNGLRVMARLSTSAMAGDYTEWTVDSRAGGILGNPVSNLEVTRNASSVRAVYIRGGNATGSGIVSDGTNRPGAVALLEDSTITTVAGRDAAGAAYLAQYAGQITGQFDYEDRPWTATVGNQIRAGSRVQIYDDALAPFATDGILSTVMQIDKSYTDSIGASGPLETWRVSFGALPASLATFLRGLSSNRPS